MARKGFIIVAITISFFMLSIVPCFSQAILGCYHHKNGKLRIVSDYSLCKKTELPITFNTGEQGPPGPQGIQGPQGVQGAKGDIGPQGPAGSVAVLSATDEYIGELVEITSNDAKVFLPSLKKLLQFNLTIGENANVPNALYYKESDCSGIPYAGGGVGVPGLLHSIWTYKMSVDEFKHYIRLSADTESFTALSTMNQGNCSGTISPGTWILLTEVVLPFTYPVMLPYILE